MSNRGQIVFGSVVILLGAVLLLDQFINISMWSLLWPLVIIGLGVWMLVRPANSAAPRIDFFPNIHRYGEWQVENDSVAIFVGDIRLDMTRADIPVGETTVRVSGFVGDVDILLPAGVGFSVSSNAFVTETKILGEERDNFLMPVKHFSENYAAAEKKIRLEAAFFVADLEIDQIS